MKKLLVNFFGGPAAGKTVAAYDLFVKLKTHKLETHLVPDLAKECVLDQHAEMLNDPITLFALQLRNLKQAYAVMDVVLVDSPILMTLAYHKNISEHLRNLVIEEHNEFDNLNVFVPRTPEFYSNAGRIHSYTEALWIDKQLLSILDDLGEKYFNWGDMESPADYLCQEILKYFESK